MNNLDDLKKLLSTHDWFYYFSDDPRYYRAGEDSAQKIKMVMETATDDMKRLYNEYHARYFNTPSFVTEDRPYVAPYTVWDKNPWLSLKLS